MKKLICILFLMLTSVCAKAQSVFDSFEKNDKVKAIVVNKKMFDLMSKIKVDPNDVDAQNYLSLIKNLDHLLVLTTVDVSTAKLLVITTNDYLAKNSFQQKMNAINNGKAVKIYVRKNDDELISKLILLAEDQQNTNNITVMTLSGNFSLNSLSILTKKMDLPGSEAIIELSK